MNRFVTSDGTAIAYDDQGPGAARSQAGSVSGSASNPPAILCLSGLTRNMGDFEPVLPFLLGRGQRVIRMDYRGRGASDWAKDYTSYTVPREALDALELLDHLGLDKVAVLGTSRGGLIAMGLAAAAPQRLAGVVLNDIGPVVGVRGLARIMDYVGRAPAPPSYAAMAAATRNALAAEFPTLTAEDWLPHVRHWYVEKPDGSGLALNYDPDLHKALLHQSAGGTWPELWPYFEALKDLPTAAIRGANSDILTAETLAEMQRRHPGMLVAEVPDRGHVPFLDEPESLAVLSLFLTLLEPRP